MHLYISYKKRTYLYDFYIYKIIKLIKYLTIKVRSKIRTTSGKYILSNNKNVFYKVSLNATVFEAEKRNQSGFLFIFWWKINAISMLVLKISFVAQTKILTQQKKVMAEFIPQSFSRI